MGTRRAILLGATGLVGSRCLIHLLACDAYEHVTCLVRRAGALTSHERHERHERLEERVVDFDALIKGSAALDDIEAVDDLFCAIGSTMKKAGSKEAFRHIDYELPLCIAKLAIARGAKRMALVSSIGADARAGNFYLKTKGELEEALTPLFSSEEKRALHVFRPSFLLGDRQESRPGEAFSIAVMRGASGLLFGGLRKYRPINVDDVAQAMVRAMAREEDLVGGKKIYEHDAMTGASL